MFSIERHKSLFNSAKLFLKENHYRAQLFFGDGFKGKKAKNARTQFKALFSFDEPEVDTEPDDSVQLDISALDQLEQEQL
mgnify:CR=1 FL=1